MPESATIQPAKRQSKSLGQFDTQFQPPVSRIADCDFPVLIEGEHGVGKRSISAQIHAQSHRSRMTFSELNSTDADPAGLLAAFSHRGTVYLAEIGELRPDLQELIVNTYSHADLAQLSRLLCGTSRELLGEVKAGRMREDFYYLVSAFTLRVSPLRCRKSEILAIADLLLTQYSKQFDRPKPVLREDMIEFLMEHAWPENLPELQTAIKTFVAIGDHSVSLAALKAASIAKPSGTRKLPLLKEATRAASSQIERQLISEVLTATGGNRKRAAYELGISYKALLYKLKQVGTEDLPAPIKNGVSV